MLPIKQIFSQAIGDSFMQNTKKYITGVITILLLFTCFSVSCQENSERYYFSSMIIKDNVMYALINKYENNQFINDLIVLYDLASNSRIGDIDPDDRINFIEKYQNYLYIVYYNIPIIHTNDITIANNPIFRGQLNVNINNYDKISLDYKDQLYIYENILHYSFIENNNIVLYVFFENNERFLPWYDYLFIDTNFPPPAINFYINNYYAYDGSGEFMVYTLYDVVENRLFFRFSESGPSDSIVASTLNEPSVFHTLVNDIQLVHYKINILVNQNRLIYTNTLNSIAIKDISDITNPLFITQFDNIGETQFLTNVGDYVYAFTLKEENYYLNIINLNDLLGEEAIKTINVRDNYFDFNEVYDPILYNDLMYLCTSIEDVKGSTALSTFDISNPFSPDLIHTLDTENCGFYIANSPELENILYDNKMYFSASSSISVVDISNPQAPALVNTITPKQIIGEQP